MLRRCNALAPAARGRVRRVHGELATDYQDNVPCQPDPAPGAPCQSEADPPIPLASLRLGPPASPGLAHRQLQLWTSLNLTAPVGPKFAPDVDM